MILDSSSVSMSSDFLHVFPIFEKLCAKNMAVAQNDWPPKK